METPTLRENQMKVFYNAVALNHIKKLGGKALADFENVLKSAWEENTIDDLLRMNAGEFLQTNANEAMSSGQSGFGADWVETVVLASELVDRLGSESSLMEKATIKEMRASQMDVPVKGAGIRMILTSENNTYPDGNIDTDQVKKAKTAYVRLTAKEFVVTVYYSDTLLEDSVVNMAEYVIGEIQNAFDRSLHEIIINGDTETTSSTNINAIDGAITTLADGAKTDLLAFNGGRKIAFTNSATITAGGNISVDVIRGARKLMGWKGIKPQDIVGLPDQDTYFDLLGLGQVETIEKFGSKATIVDGELQAIDGIKIVLREEITKANTAGKVATVTPANNTAGQFLLIHAPSLFIGLRRGLTTEMSRYAEARTTGMTGSVRLAVAYNDVQNNLQATSSTALIYNI